MEVIHPVKIRPVSCLSESSPLYNESPFTKFVWVEDNSEDKYPIREIAARSMDSLLNDPSVPLTDEQVSALSCISECKTGKLGFTAEKCPNCNRIILHSASCNNRNCPSCQWVDERIWIEKRKEEVIEGLPYYHTVLTIPSELYSLAIANQYFFYSAMLRCAGETLVQLCNDPKYGGFTPSVIAVLHTWSSNLCYHPHVHMIVSGGGLTSDNKLRSAPVIMLKGKVNFFIPENVVAALFRGKLVAAVNQAFENSCLPDCKEKLVIPDTLSTENGMDLCNPSCWKIFRNSLYKLKWVAHLKETFNANGNAIEYLGRYVFRTAISNHRIHSVVYDEEHPDGEVKFWAKDYKNAGNTILITKTGTEFLRLFVQHILPKGLCKVRYAGIIANSVKTKNLQIIAELCGTIIKVSLFKGKPRREILRILLHCDPRTCPCCGSETEPFGRIHRDELIIQDVGG